MARPYLLREDAVRAAAGKLSRIPQRDVVAGRYVGNGKRVEDSCSLERAP